MQQEEVTAVEDETAPINLLEFRIIIYGSKLNFNKECGSIESLDLHEPDESTSCNGAPSAIYYFFNNDVLGNFYLPFSDHLGLFGQLPIRVHDHFPFASFDIKGKQRAWTKTASDVVAFHSLPASVQTGKTRLPPVTINATTVKSRSIQH